jgi:hypothetical protein
MKLRVAVLAGCLATIGALGTARAADLFVVDLTVNAQSSRLTFKTAREAIDSLETQNISTQVPYSGIEPLTALMNYRGLPISMSYATAGSTALRFQVPLAGIDVTFAGSGPSVPAARDDAQDQLVAYLKKGEALGQMQKKLAEVSPVDPVAGNPLSLETQMVVRDFDTAFTAYATNLAGTATTAAPRAPDLAGIGLRFGSYSTSGLTTRAISIPFAYTVRFPDDPGQQLTFSAPVTLADSEGAKSYYAGLGVHYRVPLATRWALTSAASWALTGSRDLGSAAQIVSVSVTSSYVLPVQETSSLAIGNMIGYYRTLNLTVGDYSFDPDIANVAFRNGVMYSHPVSWFGGGLAMEYSLINTLFTGSKLYEQSYNQVGVTLGTGRSATAKTYLRAGVNYLFSDKGHGFGLNLGYWF